jgi:hypothetical protein
MDLYFYTKRKDVAATSLVDLASYIAALAAPTTATNLATISRVTDKIESLVQSDTGEPLNLYFSPDGTTYEAWSTDAAETLGVALGTTGSLGVGSLTSTTSFSISGNARVGTLAMNTVALRDAMTNALQGYPGRTGITLTLHVRKTDISGITETIALLPVFVQAGVLAETADPDTAAASYTLTDTFLSGAIHPLTGITGLTGGGAAALDGIVTGNVADPTLPTGYTVLLSYSRVMQIWQLVSGTDAEDTSAGVVRPDDYHATTNPRVWVQL